MIDDQVPPGPGARTTGEGARWPSASARGTMPDPPAPWRNVGVTIVCAVCGQRCRAGGRRRFCSDACRQAAWRARHPAERAPGPPVPLRPRLPRSAIVYECPECLTRYLGEQRCADCQRFCRRVGPGGPCPHCDEPVAVADLLVHEGGDTTPPRRPGQPAHEA